MKVYCPMIADKKIKPVSDSRLPGFWITEQKYRYTILFIAESGKTTVGLNMHCPLPHKSVYPQ